MEGAIAEEPPAYPLLTVGLVEPDLLAAIELSASMHTSSTTGHQSDALVSGVPQDVPHPTFSVAFEVAACG